MQETVDLDTKKNLIKRQALFTQLTDDETEMLAALLIEKHYKKGDTIVNEGDPVDSVFLIVDGQAEVRRIRILEGKPEITSLVTLGPDAPIGLNETGFYSISGVRTASVVATTDMIVLKLSVPAFHGFALTHAHVSEIMHNAIKDSDSAN